MNEILLLITTLLCIIFSLWKLYKPKIEIIKYIGKYSVYLHYHKYYPDNYSKIITKYLFSIKWFK